MILYRSIVSYDRARATWQLCVLWDDSDPNNIITQGTIAENTQEAIDQELAWMGFRIVGSEGPGLHPGERIVQRSDARHPFFDPKSRSWHSTPPGT
ncbi:hypothetical protein [Nocardia puris]|uniref:Uncharacterized protein n=1 Tax=Nocardia puris TaxID=208602 RepID=A0A366DQ28_9NOCA|nr:hypothetical protein [Nocardia puris]RBO91308.1 hypothetical protein DFR74_10410 [Nocardia puris]